MNQGTISSVLLYVLRTKITVTFILVCILSAATAGVSLAEQNFPNPLLTVVDTPGDGEYGKADLTQIRIYINKNTFNVTATIEGLGRVDEITMSLSSPSKNYMYINHTSMGNRYGVYKKCSVTVKSNRNITLTVPLSCLPKFAKNKPVTAIVHLLQGPVYPEVAYTIIDSVYTDSFTISSNKRK